MVYTGPSDGCHLCRKRRIKCDGGRPQCQRCVTYKAACPGYRSESDFKFVNENHAPESRPIASRRKPPSSKPTRASPDTTSISSSPSSARSDTSTSKWITKRQQSESIIPQVVAPSWDEWSVNSFMHDWTLPETDNGVQVGFLDFLPNLHATTKPNVDFSLALNAASFASFANQHKSPEMMAKARSSYGGALTALNASLRNPAESIKDTTIASIILLQIFEHITCDDSLTIGNHDAGLRMLLDMRGMQQLETAQGRGIARIIFGYLHSRDVNLQRESSNLMKSGAHKLGYPQHHPACQRRPDAPAMSVLLSELNLCHKSDRPTSEQISAAVSLMQSAVDFDATFESWEASLPEAWHWKEVRVNFDPLRSSASTVPRTGLVHIYSTALIACYTNLYRAKFVVLHNQLLRLAAHLGISDWSIPPSRDRPDGVEMNVARSLHIVRYRNNEILASAPCAMSEVNADGSMAHMAPGRAVGAYYLLWPLIHINSDPYATLDQRADAGRALSFIGNVLGIRRGIKKAGNPFERESPPPARASSVGAQPAGAAVGNGVALTIAEGGRIQDMTSTVPIRAGGRPELIFSDFSNTRGRLTRPQPPPIESR